MRCRTIVLLYCILACALVRDMRAGECATRHFYNSSSVSFTIEFKTYGSCSIGSFTGAKCTIPPGQTADLHYGNSPKSTTSIVIESSASSIYSRQEFMIVAHEPIGVTGLYQPVGCTIAHKGSTGNIVVNDPADGDVKTCGKTTYSCQQNGIR